MTHEKFIILLKKLEEKSADGSLDWEVTASRNAFQTSVSDYVLRISEQEPSDHDPESAPDYYLSLYNQQGYVIESVSDPEIRQSDPTFESFKVMKGIYKMARRSALGGDKALDSIIKGLDEIIPF
jgi:hypothetical protein